MQEREPQAATAMPAGRTLKDQQLDDFRMDPRGEVMTSDQGIPIQHTDDSLTLGERGPSLIEDFHLREKITRFDHERIPERVVHARGSAAHGVFQVYRPLTELTRAAFLQDPSVETPVFVRFSTVAGSRGSADTVRDVRGFATKFYTGEGNFDLVGNNIPVFFIQDGIKFPDIVHAVKPEPDSEMPQAASAHDTFWDFVSLAPETAHMIMWVMSDRAIPRSFATMEGFGVHTFRMVNAKGESRLVKFHWKPALGTHSLVWDEAQKIAGKDADFHRRDLWERIESGAFPEWELGLQIVGADDALKFGFDLLDATKLLPEELVPVEIVGKMTLNRNPDNFFAETEQVAFHVANVVPGIDVTDDPLMQARLFSYLDTQLTRLGGPNFAQIPINRPVSPMHNHQQDGFGQQAVPVSKAMYHPNSIGGGCPVLASFEDGGYVHFPEPVDGVKIRKRSETFIDHFSQASMFFNSLSAPEQDHLIGALQFELGKLQRKTIRERVVHEILVPISPRLATAVAAAIGVTVDATVTDGTAGNAPARRNGSGPESSPALSMANTSFDSIKGRQVAILVASGFSSADLKALVDPLVAEGAVPVPVSLTLGSIAGADGTVIDVSKSFLTTSSVLFDAVYVPGGEESVGALEGDMAVQEFIREAYSHYKPIGAAGHGAMLVGASLPRDAGFSSDGRAAGRPVGVVTVEDAATPGFATQMIDAIKKHRHWARA